MIIDVDQELFFNAYNESGIVRSGSINEDCEINMLPGEIRFVLKLTDGTIVYDTELSEEEEVFEYPDICIMQVGTNFLVVHSNCWEPGDAVKWNNINTPEHVQELTMDAADVKIERLSSGDYDISLWRGTEQAGKLYVRFVEESLEDIMDRVLLYLPNPDTLQQEAIDAVKYKMNYVSSSLSWLFHERYLLLPEDADDDEIMGIWRLIEASLLVENGKFEAINDGEYRFLPSVATKLSFPDSVDKIIFVDEFDIVAPKTLYSPKDFAYPDLAPGVLWRVEFLDDYENTTGVLRIIAPDYKTRRCLWNAIHNGNTTLADAKKTTIDLPEDWGQFNEEELELALIRRYKNPSVPLFEPPLVSVSEDGKWTVKMSNYEFMEKLDKTIYLVIQEPELVLTEGYERRIPVTGSVVTVDRAIRRIYRNEDYFLWFQDDSGKLLSKLFLMYNGEEKSREEFNAIINRQELRELGRLIVNSFETSTDVPFRIKSIIEKLDNNDETTCLKLHQNIILSMLSEQQASKKIGQQLIPILSHSMANSRLNSQFFVECYWDEQLAEVTIPPRTSDYVVTLAKMHLGTNACEVSYIDSSSTAIEIRCDDADIFVMSATDKDTLQHSGYILVCTMERSRDVLSWNINMRGLYNGNSV